MRTLGIDLATDPALTACCLIEWPGDGGDWGNGRDQPSAARIERLGTGHDDDSLLELIADADRAGIDAPIGWPRAFTEALAAWSCSGAWPPHDPRELQQRLTDRLLHERLGELAASRGVRRPNRPMSVSADRIGATAMRAARLLSRAERELGLPVDRSGLAPSRIAEVYPAATLFSWGLASTGYKRERRAERERLLGTLAERLAGSVELDAGALAECERSDDSLDALIASLTVRELAQGRTVPPRGREQIDLARSEGWIHAPAGAAPGED